LAEAGLPGYGCWRVTRSGQSTNETEQAPGAEDQPRLSSAVVTSKILPTVSTPQASGTYCCRCSHCRRARR